MSVLNTLYSIAKNPLKLMRKEAKSIDALSPGQRHQLAERVVQFLNTNKTKIFQHKDERKVKEAMALLHKKCQILDPPETRKVENFFSSYFQEAIHSLPYEKMLDIFIHLDFASLNALMSTSKAMHRLAHDNVLWRKIAPQIGCILPEYDTVPTYQRVRDYIPVLKKQATRIIDPPIKAILKRPPTVGNVLRLKQLREARDKEQIAKKLGATDFPDLESLSTDEERIATADYLYTWIQENAGRLATLVELDLSGLNLSSLPDIFGYLPALKKLSLGSNQLQTLPVSIGKLTQLEMLILPYTHLRELPESFGYLTSLQFLALEHNQLQALPDTFGNLTNLEQLFLGDNRLQALPESFSNLQALKHLELHNNQLKALPMNFGDLKSLEHLELQNNQLEKIPDTFGDLEALEHLELQDNQLEKLPDTFGDLEALRILYLRNNKLKSISHSIGDLKKLERVYLAKNPLEWLPKSVDTLTKTDFDIDLTQFERR